MWMCRKYCPKGPGQTSPESDYMVGKPAEGEGSHQDSDTAGYSSAVPWLSWPALLLPLQKGQQQEVAGCNDVQGHNEGQNYPL